MDNVVKEYDDLMAEISGIENSIMDKIYKELSDGIFTPTIETMASSDKLHIRCDSMFSIDSMYYVAIIVPLDCEGNLIEKNLISIDLGTDAKLSTAMKILWQNNRKRKMEYIWNNGHCL